VPDKLEPSNVPVVNKEPVISKSFVVEYIDPVGINIPLPPEPPPASNAVTLLLNEPESVCKPFISLAIEFDAAVNAPDISESICNEPLISPALFKVPMADVLVDMFEVLVPVVDSKPFMSVAIELDAAVNAPDTAVFSAKPERSWSPVLVPDKFDASIV
tara:strand:+ start:847 stop:1323 length:477 start_codon:yes stop_codon:yes gene_type:complete